MAIESDTAVQRQLFRRIQNQFPDLDFYDADIPVSVQFAARFDVYPTLRCQMTVLDGKVLQIAPLDSRWKIDNTPPPLRKMSITPDVDPSHRTPRFLHVKANDQVVTYALENGRLLLIGLQASINRHNPDLILTRFGDTWLFPTLRKIAQETGMMFNPSRDGKRPYLLKKAKQLLHLRHGAASRRTNLFIRPLPHRHQKRTHVQRIRCQRCAGTSAGDRHACTRNGAAQPRCRHHRHADDHGTAARCHGSLHEATGRTHQKRTYTHALRPGRTCVSTANWTTHRCD